MIAKEITHCRMSLPNTPHKISSLSSRGGNLNPFCHKTFHPWEEIIWGVDSRLRKKMADFAQLTPSLALVGTNPCVPVCCGMKSSHFQLTKGTLISFFHERSSDKVHFIA